MRTTSNAKRKGKEVRGSKTMTKAIIKEPAKPTQSIPIDSKTGYKLGCGFREQGLCKQLAENCRGEDKKLKYGDWCDLFSMVFEKKAIKKKIKLEKKLVKELNRERKELKGDDGKKKEYKELKAQINDKANGVITLVFAYDFLRGGIYSALARAKLKQMGSNPDPNLNKIKL